MGVGIEAFIEFDDSSERNEDSMEPFSAPDHGVIPLTEYTALAMGKDYDFIGAISGVRAPRGEPLFPTRGLPRHLSPQVDEAIRGLFDPETEKVGWLTLREIHSALEHMGIAYDQLSLAVQVVLRMMQFFETKLGEGRVRLVFGVE